MRRFLAVVVLAVLGAFVWFVGHWAETWVLGIERWPLFGIVLAGGLLVPAFVAGLMRFAIGRPSFGGGFAGAAIVLNGGAVAALLFAPPAPPAEVTSAVADPSAPSRSPAETTPPSRSRAGNAPTRGVVVGGGRAGLAVSSRV